jgi:hypothetical protein
MAANLQVYQDTVSQRPAKTTWSYGPKQKEFRVNEMFIIIDNTN